MNLVKRVLLRLNLEYRKHRVLKEVDKLIRDYKRYKAAKDESKKDR